MTDQPVSSDAARLEQLWASDFGDRYIERNAEGFERREAFWAELLSITPTRVLEVGCNIGGNLRSIDRHVAAPGVYGIDVNTTALARVRSELPSVNAVWSPARELPFRDGFFDLVFTAGVLIHQPTSTLPLVMAEMVRCSRRWVLALEYHADIEVEVPYRDQTGALFKRPYGALFAELFPDLRAVRDGFLGADDGWDDVTWTLFEKS